MNLQQLRYLCAVADDGFNISKAASSIHTSQPGISRQIKLLEQQLGTDLLRRKAGRVVGLTQSGEHVLAIARRILKDTDSLRNMGAEFLKDEGGVLSIGSTHIHARYVLPPVIARLRASHPTLVVDLRLGSPSQIADMVTEGVVDLGLTLEAPPTVRGLVELSCQKIPRVLMVPQGHALSGKTKVTLAEIASFPTIYPNPGTDGRWGISRVFESMGVELNPCVNVSDPAVVKALIEQGVGIGVLSGTMYDADRDSALWCIDVSELLGHHEVIAIFDPDRFLRGHTIELITYLSPTWTERKIRYAIRDALYANAKPTE